MNTPKDNSPKTIISITGNDPNLRFDAWWGLVLAAVILLIVLITAVPDPYRRILVYVSDGLLLTIGLTVLSFVMTLFAGLFGGLGRLSNNRLVFGITSLYVEIIRGIPLLVQLLWWYFAFPSLVKEIGKNLGIEALSHYRADAISMAVMGLVVCYTAYMSEIYRAGIQSIPKGQMEAARSLGMSYTQAMRYVVIPQAIRVILPPVGNEFIAMLKDSSLVSAVAVADLSRRGREFATDKFVPIETYMMIALIYLIMTLISARIVGWIERKVKQQER